jgi:phosphoheptose isomerase
MEHLEAHLTLATAMRAHLPELAMWGEHLATRLLGGMRLLAAGNGGSAAEAQHLTAEIVGKFDGERAPFSAICLSSDPSAVTAIANDYGYGQVFARQVVGHGRPGDTLILLSTSGRSANLLSAVAAAHDAGVDTWALTGPAPNPLADRCHRAIALPGPPAAVQEAHLLAVHLLCRAFDAHVRAAANPEERSLP